MAATAATVVSALWSVILKSEAKDRQAAQTPLATRIEKVVASALRGRPTRRPVNIAMPSPGHPLPTTDRLTRLASHVAAELPGGFTVGFGSGSTAEAVVRAIGARVAGGLAVTGVPTSKNTERLAKSLGIPIVQLDEVDEIDLGIDGADEIDPSLNLIKGAGGALLYEKLVALACRDYLVVATSAKLVERLGTRMSLPVEIVPHGAAQTMRRLSAIGCRPVRRERDDVPFVTDGGHWIVDCETGPIANAAAFAGQIKAVTGVVDSGIFTGIARRAAIVHPDGRIETLTRPG